MSCARHLGLHAAPGTCAFEFAFCQWLPVSGTVIRISDDRSGSIINIINMRLGGAILLLLPVNAKQPCYDSFNGDTRLETVCYQILANGTTPGLSVRSYAGADAAALVVYSNASSSITTYQEALMLTSFYVIDYFTSHNLTASRTVPLTLRPPTPVHDAWLGQMALAPSRWPPGSKPPRGEVAPLGGGAAEVTLAVFRVVMQQPPQPSDFDALCAKLEAAVKAELPGFKVDSASPFSPTHARYSGELWDGPWLIECWVGVEKQ